MTHKPIRAGRSALASPLLDYRDGDRDDVAAGAAHPAAFFRSRSLPARCASESMWPHGKRTSLAPEEDGDG